MEKQTKATIRLPQAIALYIGAVLGSGLLIVPGLAAQIAGPASLMDWGALMILAIPLAMCMAYLAQRYPGPGGVSYFVTLAFGRRAGYLIGWFFLMSVPIGAPVAALTGAGYVCEALRIPDALKVPIAASVLLSALLMNHIGMSLAGKVQIAVVSGLVAILILALIGAVPHIRVTNFEPFMPHGIRGIGAASTLLFWCFIGWEAVSHLSGEFVNPEKDVARATLISAILIGVLYFVNAVAIVGTNSYQIQSQAALVVVARQSFGQIGALLVGVSSLLICLATVITYIGAAARLAQSLSNQGHAPKGFGKLSSKHQTPTGGLIFLGFCFFLVLVLYGTHVLSLAQLIQLPNATFLINYLGGCAAGVVLFRKSRKKWLVSLISLASTAFMCLFLSWSIVYPIAITLFVLASEQAKKVWHSQTTGKE
ncbi:MAG: APC family permease [Sporolactobacillus sp.]